MSTADEPPGPGWWKASDGRWYPPESAAPPPIGRTTDRAGRPLSELPDRPQRTPGGHHPGWTADRSIRRARSGRYAAPGMPSRPPAPIPWPSPRSCWVCCPCAVRPLSPPSPDSSRAPGPTPDPGIDGGRGGRRPRHRRHRHDRGRAGLSRWWWWRSSRHLPRHQGHLDLQRRRLPPFGGSTTTTTCRSSTSGTTRPPIEGNDVGRREAVRDGVRPAAERVRRSSRSRRPAAHHLVVEDLVVGTGPAVTAGRDGDRRPTSA